MIQKKVLQNSKQRLSQKIKETNMGFTLVELIIVLSLLLLVLTLIFSVTNMVQRNYDDTNVRSAVLEKSNIAVLQINNDIRSASKPNNITNSIVTHPASGSLSKGQSIDIYYYDSVKDKYYRIGYRLLPSDRSKLQRGEVECTTSIPDKDTANPSYGVIVDDSSDYISGDGGKWKTILNGIQYRKDGVGIEIFEDVTVDTTSERRAIKLNLIVNDDDNSLKNPIIINKTITSRTKGNP